MLITLACEIVEKYMIVHEYVIVFNDRKFLNYEREKTQ